MHVYTTQVNGCQSKEERKLKYWVCREYAQLPTTTARYLRDWNWYPLLGFLDQWVHSHGFDEDKINAIHEICHAGREMFKQDHIDFVKNGRKRA